MDRKTEIALQQLKNGAILIGGWQRRKGAEALAGSDEPDAADALVSALLDSEEKVRTAARKSLSELKGKAVDRFCKLWAQGRNGDLESILLECRYLASEPPEVCMLTYLKNGNDTELANADIIDVRILLELLNDKDAAVAGRAKKILLSLPSQETINQLCRLWAENRETVAEKLILKASYVATYPNELKYLTLLKQGRAEEASNIGVDGFFSKIALLNDRDPVVKENAMQALCSLQRQEAINQFCELWEKSREPALEEILLKAGYVATAPAQLSYLTMLKIGRIEEAGNAGRGGPLFMANCLKDRDHAVRENAKRALCSLQRQEAINQFCELWERSRDSTLEEILLKAGYVATVPAKLSYLTMLKVGNASEASIADRGGVLLLVGFLKERDQMVKKNAKQALCSLQRQEAINQFCEMWEESKDPTMEEILLQAGYVATAPVTLRYLTMLKQGKVEEAANADQEGVITLLKLTSDRDSEVKAMAFEALFCLKRPEAITLLCGNWAQNRDNGLKDIILKAGYTASEPLDLHALTSFLKGKKPQVLIPGDILKACLFDKEEVVVRNAVDYIAYAKGSPTTNWIMPFLLERFDISLLKALHTASWYPEEAADRALFYFLAGDLEKYHDIDFEHKHLRYWYETAEPKLKETIAAGIRQSGQRRLLAVFHTERGGRKLNLTVAEVELQIEIMIQKQDFAGLFGLLAFATYEQGMRIMAAVQAGGWQSPDSHNRELQQRLETLMKKWEQQRSPSSLAKKIYQDFRPMFMGSEKPPNDLSGLRSWLTDRESFRHRSAALIAIAEGNLPGLKEVANSSCGDAYWQVRMAAAACELLHPNTLSTANRTRIESDHVYWVQALLKMPAGAERLVELGPFDLEKLRQRGHRSDPKVKPDGPDDFFDLLRGLIFNPEAEYLLTLGEFLGTDVVVSDETAYEATATDIEIELEK